MVRILQGHLYFLHLIVSDDRQLHFVADFVLLDAAHEHVDWSFSTSSKTGSHFRTMDIHILMNFCKLRYFRQH